MNGDIDRSEGQAAARIVPHGVLIADDDAGIRNMLGLSLRNAGFRVWLAEDGRDAIDLYRAHENEIDVLLLDIRMPTLDGPETWTALQAMKTKARCCFMSGHLGEYTEESLRERGAAAVFSKPFHLDELIDTLLRLVVRDSEAEGAIQSSNLRTIASLKLGVRDGKLACNGREQPPQI